MSTATLPPTRFTELAALTDTLTRLSPGQVARFDGVSWADYEHLLESSNEAGRERVRIQYDRGSLELMSTSMRHGVWTSLIGSLIQWLAVTTGSRVVAAGNMTVARRDLDRGFEPDACFYVQNVDRVIPLRELNFAIDPPPDLAVEVEYTRSAVGKLPILAAFGVPEVWRYDGQSLIVLILDPTGEYRPSTRSRAFPMIAPADLLPFLAMAGSTDHTTITRAFAAWLSAKLPAE